MVVIEIDEKLQIKEANFSKKNEHETRKHYETGHAISNGILDKVGILLLLPSQIN